MGFDFNGLPELDATVEPRAPSQKSFVIGSLAAPGAIGGTTPGAGAFTTLDASGAVALASTLDVNGATTLDGATSITATATLATTTKLQARDAGIFLNSSVDGQLDIDADGEIEITTPSLDINVTATDISGTLAVGGAATFAVGSLSTAQTVNPAADSGAGSTILPGVTAVAVGAVVTNANDWIVLPAIAAVPIGHTIRIACNAGGNFEMRTPAASNTKINDVDSDGGAAEYLCTDTELITVVKHTTTGWVAFAHSKLGAAVVAVVPHAN